MKAHDLLLPVAIVFSIACYSQDDSINTLASNSDTIPTNLKYDHNSMIHSSTKKNDRITPDGFVLTLNTEGKKGKDIETLSHLLTDSFDGDSDKVRAIFYWMTENISYDCKQFHNHETVQFSCGKKEIYDHAVERWHYKLARKTLIERKGVCEDYALLFKYLCDYAGIESLVIVGYGANGGSKISTSLSEKASNHAWNIVWINDKPYPLDVCWASGYCDKGTKIFTQELNEKYYLTSPEVMILDHHPKDAKWQLLSSPVKMKKFVEVANSNFDN